MRNDETEKITVTVGDNPTPVVKAKWQYFKRLGFSIREFLVNDSIRLRTLRLDNSGVITRFVKPDSPGSSAGLQMGDWIKEIDGTPTITYDDAIKKLQAIEDDSNINDFVMLISRDNETKVLKIKLD